MGDGWSIKNVDDEEHHKEHFKYPRGTITNGEYTKKVNFCEYSDTGNYDDILICGMTCNPPEMDLYGLARKSNVGEEAKKLFGDLLVYGETGCQSSAFTNDEFLQIYYYDDKTMSHFYIMYVPEEYR